MTTQAQRWARERNWNKACLITAQATIGRAIRSKSTIIDEKDLLLKAYTMIGDAIYFYPFNKDKSKEQYLKEV